MKFIQYLQEEYLASLSSYHNTLYTVYKNPTVDDFKELSKTMKLEGAGLLKVRYIVDLKNRDVYIWGFDKCIHCNMHNYLERNYNLSIITIEDEGYISNNKIDSLNFIVSIKKRKPTLDWTKSYFLVA